VDLCVVLDLESCSIKNSLFGLGLKIQTSQLGVLHF